jgi:hypothetical protein
MQQLLVAVAAGVYGCIWALVQWKLGDGSPSDFDQVWYGARALLAGADPYQAVGPKGTLLVWDWPLYYPLPALLIATPLTILPVIAARVCFVTASAALLGYAVSRDGLERLPLFFSASFIMAAKAAQWSPLLVAAALLWPASWLLVAKPNVGAIVATLAAKRAWWSAIIGAAVLVGISFVVRPDWFNAWRANVSSAPHFAPLITHRGGFVLLLAALKWRRQEAWLVLAYALVPHTPVLYETVALFLIPSSRRQSLLLACCSGIAFALQLQLGAPDTAQLIHRLGDVTLWLVHVPALALILMRPNEGTLPRWIEQATSRLPVWLRGTSQAAEA